MCRSKSIPILELTLVTIDRHLNEKEITFTVHTHALHIKCIYCASTLEKVEIKTKYSFVVVKAFRERERKLEKITNANAQDLHKTNFESCQLQSCKI